MSHGNVAWSLRRTIEEAEAKLRVLEQIPSQDDFPHLTMVRVVVRPRYGNDNELTYLLLKVVDDNPNARPRWYHTGVLTPPGKRSLLRDDAWLHYDKLVSWLVHDVELISWNELVPAPVSSNALNAQEGAQ